MNYGVSDANLTPAAQQVLDTLTDEYKSEILLNATRLAAGQTGEIQEISVRDIIEGSKQVDRANQLFGKDASQNSGRARSTLDLILKIYRWLGIAAILGGIVYFFFATADIQLDADQFSALLFVVAGLFFALLPYLYNQFRRSSRFPQSDASDKIDLVTAFIMKWQDTELATRDVAATKLGESFAADESITFLMAGLQRLEILGSEDVERLRYLLALRNRILHEGLRPGRDELERASRDADKIRVKLLSQR